MSKQHANKNPHEGLIQFIADKHYDGQHLDQIKTKLLTDEALFNKALDEFRQNYFKDLDSAAFSSKYLKKYGNPFSEQQPTATEEAAPIVEQPAADPVAAQARAMAEQTMANPYEQIMLNNGQALNQQPNVLPEVNIQASGGVTAAEMPGAEVYQQLLPDPELTKHLPDVSQSDRTGFIGGLKDVGARGYNALIPGLVNTAGNVTEFLGDAWQMQGGGMVTDDKITDQWADSMRGTSKDLSAYVSPEGMKSVTDDPTSPRAWFGTLAEAGANMAQIMVAGAATGGTGAVIAGGAMGLSSVYDAADEAGVSDEDKVALGAVLAPAMGMLERIGLDKVVSTPAVVRTLTKEVLERTGGKLSVQSVSKAVAEIMPEVVKTHGKQVLKSAASEGATEAAQTALQEGSEVAYDATVGEGKKKGEGNYGTLENGMEEALLNVAKESAAAGAVGGIVGGTAGAVAGKTAPSQESKVAVIEQELQKPDLNPDIREVLEEKLTQLQPEVKRYGDKVYYGEGLEKEAKQVQVKTKDGAERPISVTNAEPTLDKAAVKDLGAWEAVTDENGVTKYVPKKKEKPAVAVSEAVPGDAAGSDNSTEAAASADPEQAEAPFAAPHENGTATVKESFMVGKASYSVEKTDDGYKVTNTSTGKELTNPDAVNYKSAVKQYEAKQLESKTLQQRNTLTSSVQALSEQLKGTKPQEQEARKRLVQLSAEADKAGLELKENKKKKQFELIDKATGKKVSVKNSDTPTSPAPDFAPLAERSQQVQDIASRLLEQAKTNPKLLQGLGLGISRDSDLKGTLADIEQGKNTNRANQLLNVVEKASKDGFFEVSTQEGAGVVRRSNPSIEEYLSNTPLPTSTASEQELDAAFSGSKSIKDFIGSEGILNEDGTVNYDTLHGKLNSKEIDGLAWVYDLSEQDITELKALVNENRSNGNIRKPGQTETNGNEAAGGQSAGLNPTDRGGESESTAEAEVAPASKFDQQRSAIQEKRQSIKDRIKEKSAGRLNALPVDLIGDYAELAATYVQEGIVGIKEIAAKLKAEHRALFSSAEELSEDDITAILKRAEIAPQAPAAATKDRRHTQRLLASPDLSEDFKNGITEQDKKYIPTTNELNSAEADAFIEIKGAEVATRDALDMDNGMHPATRALLRDKLITHFDKLGTQRLQEGDEVTAQLYFDKAESITSAKVERGTFLGQELQAYRVVANSTPERVLYNTRKQVDKTRKEELKKVKPSLDKKAKAVREANKQSIAQALEKGNVKAAIQKAMKEEGINIAAVVKKHFTVVDQTGKTLADKLVEQSKLTGDEAKALANLVQKEFSAIATKKKQQLLKQTLTPKERLTPTQSKQLHDKIIELSNMGALSDQQLADLYADKMGLPKLTPEQTATILKLADKAQRAKDGIPKHKALQELLKYQEGIKGFATVDLARSIWYANILSGYSTQMINAFANLNQTAGELYTSTVMHPKALPFLLNGLVQGYSRGRWEALNVLKTGESPVRGGKINIPNALERVTFKGGNWNPFNYLKYVQRIMEASDTFSYYGLKEMRAHELAYAKAREAGVSKPTQQMWEEVTETLFRTSERRAAAEETATEEGLKGSDYKRRVFELMEQARPVDLAEDTHDFASLGTFNHDPQGTLGFLTDNIARITRSVKGASYIVPFTRIISNVANSYLDWSPYGLFRAAKGRTGNLLSDSDSNKKYRKEYTAEERAKLLIKSGTGMLAATALYALSAPGEGEDEPQLQITANGPGDYKAQAELAETGWQRYSIKIGGTWYSYQNTPLAIPLSIIGRIRDDEQYNGHSLEDEGYAAKVGIYLLNTIQYFSDMTFLKGVSEFLGAVNGGTPDQAGNYIKRTAANTAKSFVVPNLFTQVSREVQAVADIPMKESPSILGKMVRDIPIARNQLNDMVNSLGEPVFPDTDRIASAQQEDPVWNLIVRNNAWIRKPYKGSIVIYDKGKERGLTDEEYFMFCKIRGQYIKQKITDNLARLQRMNQGEVQEMIQGWKAAATKKAKAELRR